MKKVMFYIPVIIFAIIYTMVAVSSIGPISPIVVVWLTMFLTSGILLNRGMFFGGLLGILPAIHLIYMGTQETGQIINEKPIGIVVLIYYIICGLFVYINNKKTNSNL